MNKQNVLLFLFSAVIILTSSVLCDLEDWEDMEERQRENGDQASYVPRIQSKNPPNTGTGSGVVDYVYYDNREKMGTLDERLRKTVLNMKNKIAVPAVD